MTDTQVKKTRYKPKQRTAGGAAIQVTAMTIEQFRSYLKGIMFVGGEDWFPDRAQWEAIVGIIDNLIVSPSPIAEYQPPKQSYYQPAEQMQFIPQIAQQESTIAAQSGEGDSNGYRSPFV